MMDATESTRCENCGEVMTQTAHRCNTWRSTTYHTERLRVAMYDVADNTILKQEQSRRDVEAKRKQLRGKRKWLKLTQLTFWQT